MHAAASRRMFAEDTAHLTAKFAAARGWTLHEVEFPRIDCCFAGPHKRSIRLRLWCDDWNDQPPSIEILDPDGSPVSKPLVDPNSVFNQGPHPVTLRPFICTRGSREYHTHQSHGNDLWENVKDDRGKYGLGGILSGLWDAWIDLREG
ncbi:MAG: hypothetical protein OXG82_06125 [Gammaproteobacteria bacterium]|nr:hypothetical protein [Gammaproteobacteria bacterium]